MSSISIVLKQRRNALGLTLAEVADKVGVSEATVQRWESGNIKNLRHDRIGHLAEVLQVSPAVLMGWDGFHLEVSDTDPQIDRILAHAKTLNAAGLAKLGDYAEDLSGNPAYQKKKPSEEG